MWHICMVEHSSAIKRIETYNLPQNRWNWTSLLGEQVMHRLTFMDNYLHLGGN